MQKGKKLLSIFLVMLMVLSCWVWVDPEHAHVHAASAADYPANVIAAFENYVDAKSGDATIEGVSGRYFTGDSDTYVGNAASLYKNVAYSGTATSVASATNVEIRDANALTSFHVYYPATVLMYDGTTEPQFGISIEKDPKDDCRVEHWGTEMSAEGLAFVNGQWWGFANGSGNGKFLDAYYGKDNGGQTNVNCGHTSATVGSYNYDGGQNKWCYLANLIKYNGKMDDNTYSVTITPSFKTCVGQPSSGTCSATQTVVDLKAANTPVYVINVKTWNDAVAAAISKYQEISANEKEYSAQSIREFKRLAKALLDANPNNITTWSTDVAANVSNYATNAKKAVDNWNNWSGLKKATVEVTYENLFSLSGWYNSNSSNIGNADINVNTTNGTVYIKNNNTGTTNYETVTDNSGSAARNSLYYAMPVTGGKSYTLTYTQDTNANTQMFVFFYGGDSDNDIYTGTSLGTYGAFNMGTTSVGTATKEFTAPEGATCAEIRFDMNTNGQSATFSNIMFYETGRVAEAGLNEWNNRLYRKVFTYGDSFSALDVPARPGYTFAGWYVDADGNSANGYETLFDASFVSTLTRSWAVVSKWTENQYNVAFNANTGSGSMATLNKKYTEQFTLTKNTFTKPGHNFVGWNTKADGTGTAYANEASVSKLAANNNATVTLYAQWKPIEYKITWVNHDNSVLFEEYVPYGTTPVYNGETPVREGDAQYSYTFSGGWVPNVTSVVGEATYKAQFTPVINTYTVTWVNEDGTVLETDKNVPYNTTPTYNGETPTKAPTAEFSYIHSGWTPSVSPITGDVTYKATYTESRNSYTVTWKNEDGTVLDTDTVPYGTVPSYTGATPEKAKDAQFTYTHSGWTPEIKAVTGDVTYTATYSNTTNTYTVTWKNEDGTVLETDTDVPYGTNPTYDGATPEKAADAQYTYTHSGWTPEVDSVTGDVTYTATFSSTVNEYTITWVDGNGKTLETEKVAYGETPEYEGATPTKAPTAQYSYTFNNSWSPAIAEVTKDATYTAQFSSTVNTYTITWVDGNGATIKTDVLEYNAMPGYSGLPPTKAQDEQYTYTWDRTWLPAITNVVGNATYTAQFTATPRTYTVTWENYDGTVLGTDTVAYGTVPTYTGETPTKDSDVANTYTFAGWTTEVVAVTGNVTYTAKFNSAPRKYTITWVNEDETVLFVEDVEYNTVPVYGGATPTKAADVQYTYTHSGWTPEIVAVTGEATYTATYKGTLNEYTVTFQFVNGEITELKYNYGTTVEMIGIPANTKVSHDDDWHYSYEWPEIREVTGNVTYEETETKTAHSFGEGVLTKPVFTDGEWINGYYTFTCNVDGDTHTRTEDVKRADYTEYTEALNKLEELLDEDLDAEDIAEINSVIAANTVDNNLIESEQDIIDTATEKLKVTFDKVSEHLIKFTVTFIVNGETVKTETVVNGKSATAPADPAGYYDDDYHYTFTRWDNAFTNVTEDITVTAIFESDEHNFTIHTDKDDEYHTDECECGYTKDVDHSYNDGEVTKDPTCTHEGEMTFTCSLCEGTRTETVPVDEDAHKEEAEYIETIAPTCSAVGEEKLYCEYCDTVLDTREVAIDEDAHKWEAVYTVDEKATCEKAGSKSYHCEYCDDINENSIVVIPMRAHVLRDTTVAQAATCIAKGIMNQECVNEASDEYEACTFTTTREIEINPDNHAGEHNIIKNAKDATCTATGYTGDTYWSCCDKLFENGTEIPVDKDAHTGTPTNIEGKVDATCYKEGYTGDTYWTCCDALYEKGEVTEKTAHTEGEVEIENKIPATATVNGSYDEVIYCTICREEISRVKKTYSAQEILPGLPENGKVVIDIDEDGSSTENLDKILGVDAEYKSDDITVDKDGNITATEDGEAVITVTTPDGEEIDITVTVRTLKTIIFVMKDETVTVKAYKGDRLTAPTVNDFIEDGFVHVFKSWSPAISVVAGDITYTAIYTEPCDYDEFDRLSGLFDEIVNGGLVDDSVLESNKEIIDELLKEIAAINEVRDTRDKSEQAIIDAVVEKLDELVLRIYPDAGSTLEIFGAATYYVGTVIDLRVMKMPLGTVVSDVEWSSSDEDVVFFADGKLYAFGTGTATLTATKGLITAKKTITVVAGGNARSINFTAVDLTVNFLIEGYKQLYDSTLLYWSDDTQLRFRVNVYANPVFRDYIVYANGVEIEMDENSYYVIPAGSGDVQIVIAGELYEEEEEENKDPVTKWSLWDWILDFFRKIGDFFRNLFS